MVRKSQLVTAATLVALGSAAPTKRSNTIKQVSKGPGLSGQAAYAKALQKFGGSVERLGQIKASSGGATTTPTANDEEYLTPVQIGSQTFQLDFDTGSSDLWVFGPDVSGGSHTIYQPGSTASQEQGETWSISYGDGSSAGGNVYSDTVAVGDCTVTGQAVEAATTASDSFTSGTSDGLLGLAWNSINTVTPDQQQTFFSNAISQGITGVLSADLRKGEPGSYTFGDIPSDLYSGDIAYTPVDNSQGFWSFTPDSYAIGGQTASGNLAGIADTGTTLLLAGSDVVSAYWGQVSSAQQQSGQYMFDCSATLPDFSLTVAGYTATVPGSYINYADNGDGTCYGGIQEASGLSFNIYGDIFLKSQFVVFDQDNTQLGLAAKSGN